MRLRQRVHGLLQWRLLTKCYFVEPLDREGWRDLRVIAFTFTADDGPSRGLHDQS